MGKEERLHKEIDLIQDCIKRMANNSFLIKGWTITLIGGILAMADKKIERTNLLFLTLIIEILFWALDAYYLRIERMYRELYNWVIEKRKEEDYTLEYDLNYSRFENEESSIIRVMFSKTLRRFYGGIALIISSVIVILLISSIKEFLTPKIILIFIK